MDILEMALSLEHDLAKYYLEQADLNKDNSLNVIFLLLANEEENHVKILESKVKNLSYPLHDSNVEAESQKIFKNMDDFKSDISDFPSQLESYRMAYEKEKESYEFYKKALDEACDENSKTIFSYLLKQEDTHCNILEELIKLVTRPDEWVESAEFGIREDY